MLFNSQYKKSKRPFTCHPEPRNYVLFLFSVYGNKNNSRKIFSYAYLWKFFSEFDAKISEEERFFINKVKLNEGYPIINFIAA